jgi:hypothetical protein
MVDETPPPPPKSHKRIDSTFRNGSVTAIGVVLAFSLGFLNNWSALPTAWVPTDLIAVVLLAVGIGFQIWGMAGMLEPESLDEQVYRRLVRFFLIGLGCVAFGVFLAIGTDAINYAWSLIKK